jgi:hypothetical protein
MIFNAAVAALFAATFLAALSIRAWRNTNRILGERRIAAHLRAAARFQPPADADAQAALRASLVAAAARTPLTDRTGGVAADYIADDTPIPYTLTSQALTAGSSPTAGSRCASTMPYRYLRGGQPW